MTAPATAPIGPSTTAPDKAPNAASPVRSWAIAAEDISARESTAVAIVFFLESPTFASNGHLCLAVLATHSADRV